MSGIHRDDQGGDPLLKLLRGIGRVALLLHRPDPGLLPFSKGAAPVHAAGGQGVVIRADRIEIKGFEVPCWLSGAMANPYCG